ncbi:MAG: methyl-accepting chemotaxis protein [Hyphomicrobiales bacterium]
MAMAVEALRKVAMERKELESIAGAERARNETDRAEARVQNLRRYAEMLESINRSTIDLARLAKNADDASANSQTISAAAEELVASVEAITASSGETAAEAENADLAASEGREAVEGVTETISAITDAVAGTSASMSVLTEASQQIGAILESIQGISNQTNLLALNATIEAARAGEAGKGFAVVASEVKSLASQTSVLTEEIAKRIEALQKGIAMIGETMQRSRTAVAAGESAVGVAGNTMFSVTERVTRVSANMQEISAILGQQMTASGEIAASISSVTGLAVSNARIVRTITGDIQDSNKRISDIAARAFEATSPRELCEMAKIDHIMFKKRVVDTLLGGAEWNVKDVPDHHHCRLGKWFDGVKDPAISSQPAYAALKHPHAIVHSAAREALEAGAEGRIEEALNAAERMNEASAEVLRHLNALSDALAGISPAKAA